MFIALLCHVQRRHYGSDLQNLLKGKSLCQSNLSRLELWLDNDGLLSVGERVTLIHGQADK